MLKNKARKYITCSTLCAFLFLLSISSSYAKTEVFEADGRFYIQTDNCVVQGIDFSSAGRDPERLLAGEFFVPNVVCGDTDEEGAAPFNLYLPKVSARDKRKMEADSRWEMYSVYSFTLTVRAVSMEEAMRVMYTEPQRVHVAEYQYLGNRLEMIMNSVR